MKKVFNSIIVLTAITALFLTSCGSASQSNDGALKVLASTTFLADIAQNVAGDRTEVTSLLPVGADPHSYQAAPSDVVKLSDSTVLIINGVEYEHFIEPLLENADGERLIITATDGLEPHQMEEHADEADADAGHDHAAGDPHMWLDPNLVIKYAENIRDGLIEADPDGGKAYQSNADAYIAQLKDLDAWIVEQVNTIPAERRLLVTNHEAIGYFAERYGFTVIGAVVPSLSTDAAPSAKQMAELTDQIKSTGAPSIFLGEVENPALAQQIANETGIKVVDNLYLETLTEGAPAATYIDMMKHNVTRIVGALK